MAKLLFKFLAVSILLGEVGAARAAAEGVQLDFDGARLEKIGLFDWFSSGDQTAATVTPADVADPIILVVGLDLSSSNPLIAPNSDLRAKAAKWVQEMIAGTADQLLPPLPVGSMILVRTFGDADPTHQGLLEFEKLKSIIIVDRNTRPIAAKRIGEIIANVPQSMAKSGIKPQGATYVVGFLADVAREVKEADDKYHRELQKNIFRREFKFRTKVVLLSDGIECSPSFDFENAKSTKLPDPYERFHQCEELSIYGLAAGGPGCGNAPIRDRVVRFNRVYRAWDQWAKDAGCSRFSGKD